MKKISFEELVDKIGMPEAYCMFWDKLPEGATDKFAYSDWKDIYINGVCGCLKGKELIAVSELVIGKMIEKATSPGETLFAYRLTQDGSPQEQKAFEKISKLQDPEELLETFKKNNWIFKGKVFSYIKSRVKDLVNLP